MSFLENLGNGIARVIDSVVEKNHRASVINRLRIVIRTVMLDCQNELKRAWKAIVDAGGPEAVPEAMEYFNRLPFEYAGADAAAQSLRRSETRTAVDIARTTREWRDTMRANYRKAEKLAKGHPVK